MGQNTCNFITEFGVIFIFAKIEGCGQKNIREIKILFDNSLIISGVPETIKELLNKILISRIILDMSPLNLSKITVNHFIVKFVISQVRLVFPNVIWFRARQISPILTSDKDIPETIKELSNKICRGKRQ